MKTCILGFPLEEPNQGLHMINKMSKHIFWRNKKKNTYPGTAFIESFGFERRGGEHLHRRLLKVFMMRLYNTADL